MPDQPQDHAPPDQPLREHLRALLTARQAHATFEDAVKDFPAAQLKTPARTASPTAPGSCWSTRASPSATC